MKTAKELTVRFGVSIAEQRASGVFQKLDECVLLELLSDRLNEMLADLGRAECIFNVGLAVPKKQASGFLFTLEFDGVACFGPLDTGLKGSIDVKQLAWTMVETAFTNRDSLLARALEDGEWERVSRDLPTDWIPRSAFNELLAAAVRHGLNVPDAVDRLVSLFNGGLHLDQLQEQIEAILASQVELVVRVRTGAKYDELAKDVIGDQVRKSLFVDTGVLYPPLEFELDEQLAAGQYRLALNRLWSPVMSLESETIADSLVNVLKTHGRVFTTMTVVDSALGQFAKGSPQTSFNAIELFGTSFVLKVLRALIDEGISIVNLRTILSAMMEVIGTLPARYEGLAVFLPIEATFLAEHGVGYGDSKIHNHADSVRVELRGEISQTCADQERTLHVFRISERLEKRLLLIGEGSLGEYELAKILSNCRRLEVGPIGTVILAPSRSRRPMRKLIRNYFPNIPVLCQAEISPYVTCEELGVLEVD